MKRAFFTLVFVGFLLSAALTVQSWAEGEGPSAIGNFQIVTETGRLQEVKFSARMARDGSTTGEITFRDGIGIKTPAAIVDTGDLIEDSSEFYAKAVCDCLVVRGVEAVMVGTVTESNRETYVGRRILVAVQDGDSLKPPLRDKLTFGFYRKIAKGWLTSDSERDDPQGQAPSWVASDSERTDEAGIIPRQDDELSCESIPLNAHSFISARGGKGTIQVTR
jgi:hypothetical protein